jgi:L-asparaginase II
VELFKMINPIIAEITRGVAVESQHRGAFAVVNANGEIILSAGDIEKPVFPRSAIKAFQCLPALESGAADHFKLSEEEIALCCSSHEGEVDHVRVATSILQKIGISEECYECGAHWPTSRQAAYQLVRNGQPCKQIHNNCSGKHAGMLAFAVHSGFAVKDYVTPTHPVQRAIAKTMGEICEFDLDKTEMGIDGCSVPTWALPLKNTALGFAKLPARTAGQRIIAAARNHPFMIAGTTRFDTKMMQAVPRLFIKVGAEGVFCGTIAHAGLGFALKCDDGATRGAEVAVAHMLAKLNVWSAEEVKQLQSFQLEKINNWRKLEVGERRANF